LPIFFTWALMPILDIPLDVGTVMIASVALGLVVDDTIHFLSKLKENTDSGKGMKRAISDTMNRVGRPIIFTSIVLSFGFLVLIFASFNPVIHFGVLASAVIILALIFDLIVLPAILGFIGLTPRSPR
jgi:predicted RND superfamily exporter protein